MIAFGGGCSVGQRACGIGQSIGQWIGQSEHGIGQCYWAIGLGNNWAMDWAIDWAIAPTHWAIDWAIDWAIRRTDWAIVLGNKIGQ